MLSITVPETELFDEEKNEFVGKLPAITLELSHSLVSISKWESIWEKPFLSQTEKTTEETYSYVECMNTVPDVPKEVFNRLTNENLMTIRDYIDKKMTATWFTETPGTGSKGSGEATTSEIVYYWMITLGIPTEYESWHFSRLLTLIKVCNEKNSPKKKMSRSEAAAHQRTLNQQRRARFNTNG